MAFTPQEIEKRASELIEAGVSQDDVVAFINKAKSELEQPLQPAPAAAQSAPAPTSAPVAAMDPALMRAAAMAGGGGMVGGYPINAQQARSAAAFLAEGGLPAAGQAVGTPFGPLGTAAGGFLGGMAGQVVSGAIRGEMPGMGQIVGGGISSAVPGKPLRDIGRAGLALEAGKQAAAQMAAGATEAAIEGRSMTGPEAAARATGAILGTIGGKAFDMGAIADAETRKRLGKAVEDEVIAKAAASGAKLLPSDVNTSKLNRLIEALAGRQQLVGEIKELNEEWATNMASKAVGLPARTPVLTTKILEDARAEAGKVYETIDGLRQIAQRNLDAVKKPLLTIGDKHEMEVALGNKDTVEKMSKLALQASADVNEFRREQFKARSYYKMNDRTGDPDALDKARAAEEAALVLANKIKRGLESMDRGDLWKQFEASRKRIAMIHQVEDALNLETGTVSGKAMSQALNRGAPLTDQLETVGKFAGLPKSSKYFSAGDTGNIEAKGVVAELADAALRSPARQFILSPAYQQFMAKRPVNQAIPDFLARTVRSGTQSAVPGTLLQFYSEIYPRNPNQQPVPYR